MKHHSYTAIGTAMAVALLVSACASSTRAVSTQIETPASRAAWRNTAQGVVAGTQNLSRWWEQLGDETLFGLIEQSLTGSLDIRTAQARLRQARAQRDATRADLVPSVSGSASASGRNDSSGFSPGFDASWEPDIFGRTHKAVDAASADASATTDDLYAAQTSLVAEVARNYIELRTDQARLGIARENLATQQETLELTQYRGEAGLVSSVDVERARANMEQTRAQIPQLEGSVSQTIHRLSTLGGLDPAALIEKLSEPEPLPGVPEAVAVGIPAETLRQRADVRAAEQRVIAETARVAQSKTARYPRFSLSGSVGTQLLSGALSGGTSLVSSLAGSLLQNIFDGGRIRQQIEIQTAVQEQSVTAYERTVLTALEEVENALVAYEKARQRLASLESSAAAANNAAELARAQYNAGLTDFPTVLDTERTVLSVEDGIAATKGDRLNALIQLFKALGGGWTPAADREPETRTDTETKAS